MVNGQLVRVNELQHITSRGFIVKIYSDTKMPSEWEGIMSDFENTLRSAITEDEVKSEVSLLQYNSTNRATLQVPYCREFRDLHRVMILCVEFCDKYQKKEKRINYFAGKMDLEQAFLAYASYQQDNKQAARG
jgi:hypothetical protein